MKIFSLILVLFIGASCFAQPRGRQKFSWNDIYGSLKITVDLPLQKQLIDSLSATQIQFTNHADLLVDLTGHIYLIDKETKYVRAVLTAYEGKLHGKAIYWNIDSVTGLTFDEAEQYMFGQIDESTFIDLWNIEKEKKINRGKLAKRISPQQEFIQYYNNGVLATQIPDTSNTLRIDQFNPANCSGEFAMNMGIELMNHEWNGDTLELDLSMTTSCMIDKSFIPSIELNKDTLCIDISSNPMRVAICRCCYGLNFSIVGLEEKEYPLKVSLIEKWTGRLDTYVQEKEFEFDIEGPFIQESND